MSTFAYICIFVVIFIVIMLVTAFIDWFVGESDGGIAWITSSIGFAICLTLVLALTGVI